MLVRVEFESCAVCVHLPCRKHVTQIIVSALLDITSTCLFKTIWISWTRKGQTLWVLQRLCQRQRFEWFSGFSFFSNDYYRKSELKLFYRNANNTTYKLHICNIAIRLRRLLARPPAGSSLRSPTPHPQLAPLATPLQVGSKTAASNRLKRPWRSDWGHGLERPRRTDWGRGLERPQGGTLTPQKAKNSWRPRRPRRPASTGLKPPHPWVEATCQVWTS